MRTSGRSPSCAWIAASPASTCECGRGLAEATEVYSGGECGGGGLVIEQQQDAIVLVVLRRYGLSIGKLRDFGLVGVGEKHCWLGDCVDLSLQDLLHCLQFYDEPRKV